MTERPQTNLIQIKQKEVYISYDEQVSATMLAKIWEDTQKFLLENGELVSQEVNHFGPWMSEGIIAPSADGVFKIGNVMVQNRYVPVGMESEHRLIIVGSDIEAQRVENKINSGVPRYLICSNKGFKRTVASL